MKELVRLRTRQSRNGKTFVYLLDYVDGIGKRRRISLGHANKSKAQRQRVQKQRELIMGITTPTSMRLSVFVEDSLSRTGDQIRTSTRIETIKAMADFIAVVGDINYRKVTMYEGERYRQALLEKGNGPSTIIKKIKCLKHLFQLAVDREQLKKNPVKKVKTPKAPKKKIEIYTKDECSRIVKAAGQMKCSLRWDILIALAIETGMRKSELLNLTMHDIDFERICVDISPKLDTKETWRWNIKDVDRRAIPITERMLDLLAEFQLKRPSGYPYVFIPSGRYDYIQSLRSQNKPAPTGRNELITNFSRTFKLILKKAGVRHRQFHDLRSTAITNWLYNGLKEHEVMRLAGHASFETTHRFYLAVQPDLYERARLANTISIGNSLAHIWRAP